jgi:hypothetical protein
MVFDTSAFINGWNDHYKPATFPSVWHLLEEAIKDGRIIVPRAVHTELCEKDDALNAWINRFERDTFVQPESAEVQALSGDFYSRLPNPDIRDRADPFVLAEAQYRGMTVVTYEGRSFDGRRTKNWDRRMPGVCQEFGIDCCTLPEALERLGGSF